MFLKDVIFGNLALFSQQKLRKKSAKFNFSDISRKRIALADTDYKFISTKAMYN